VEAATTKRAEEEEEDEKRLLHLHTKHTHIHQIPTLSLCVLFPAPTRHLSLSTAAANAIAL